MKKLTLFILTMIITFSITGFNRGASENLHVETQYIRVGLKYGSKAVNASQVYTKGIITYGVYNGDNFIPLYKGKEGEQAVIKKDDYYHIVIAGFGGDLDKGLSYIDELRKKNVDGFLMYDEGGYSVVTGEYMSQEDANNALNSLKNIILDRKLTVVNPAKAIYIITSQKISVRTDRLIVRPSNNFIEIDNDTTYRGELWFVRQDGSDMTVINYLPLEQYLYSVVPSEMPSSWPMEALKAQAVAARSYAVANLGANSKYAKYGFDVSNDVSSQAYNGYIYTYNGNKYSGESSRTNEAVDDTKGIVLIYNGKVIDALYFSHSGGYTENSEDVFKYAEPYYRSVNDPYSLGYNPDLDNWSVTYTQAELKDMLKKKGIDVGDILDIKITDKSSSGRATSVIISGTKNNYTLQGETNIRMSLGLKSAMIKSIAKAGEKTVNRVVTVTDGRMTIAKDIESLYAIKGDWSTSKVSGNLFVISKFGLGQLNDAVNEPQNQSIPESFTFVGSGSGHGVGMSQYGARGLAEKAGKSFIDILKYYYKDITVFDTTANKSL
ncbi:stage II sporulation protein D [Caldanaerobius fijiensis DSM 17918]|uniref:Stage II sporulation protein D n=1 Tax=Caldanaerobius fijiensis DSM 17918 TaxID=1121256 RepID=A0A1M4TXF2_9THEO|nr:stage II sporulation protein D [Caldanaerobius fijiensis DSM 17918]